MKDSYKCESDKCKSVKINRCDMDIRICPQHKKAMVSVKTKYGLRFKCPDCDIYCWDGPTSMPGTPATHKFRKQAHEVFDPLWKSGKVTRKKCYRQLSAFMSLARKDTHIGMFDVLQCRLVIAFAVLKGGSVKNSDR